MYAKHQPECNFFIYFMFYTILFPVHIGHKKITSKLLLWLEGDWLQRWERVNRWCSDLQSLKKGLMVGALVYSPPKRRCSELHIQKGINMWCFSLNFHPLYKVGFLWVYSTLRNYLVEWVLQFMGWVILIKLVKTCRYWLKELSLHSLEMWSVIFSVI